MIIEKFVILTDPYIVVNDLIISVSTCLLIMLRGGKLLIKSLYFEEKHTDIIIYYKITILQTLHCKLTISK